MALARSANAPVLNRAQEQAMNTDTALDVLGRKVAPSESAIQDVLSRP